MKKTRQQKAREEKILASQIQERFSLSEKDNSLVKKNVEFIDKFISEGKLDFPEKEYNIKTKVPEKYFNIKPKSVDYRRYEKYIQFVYQYRFHIDTSDFKRLTYIYDNIYDLDQCDRQLMKVKRNLLGYDE